MNKNFVKMVLRFLKRNKTYTILNFICLSFGLTCAIIAMLYVQTLLNHDKFNENYDRLYSVESVVTFSTGDRFLKSELSASLDDMLKAKAPEIEAITRVYSSEYTFLNGDKSFTEQGIYADSSFFRLFTYPLLYGNQNNALKSSGTIVVSEKMAMKFFGTTDCIGKSLALKEEEEMKDYYITGVLKKNTDKSVFDFEFIIPFADFLTANPWAKESDASANQTWVLLNRNANKEQVSSKICNLIKDQEETLNQELVLFPLGEKMLYKYANGKMVWAEMRNLAIVGVITLAILLIACFNFINLSVAMNIKRYKEVGIKKVTGAAKSTIIFQYLGETLLITLVSLVSAVIIVSVLLPFFNMMFNADAHLRFASFSTILFFIVVTLFTAFISGIIPALYLGSSDPVSVLKGKAVKSQSFSVFRQGLIVFQFVIPIVLIICLMIMKNQDKFLENYNVGIDKDNVIALDNTQKILDHSESIKAELLSIPGVEVVNFTNCIPTYSAQISSDVSWEGKDDSGHVPFWCINTDFDYNKIVDLKIVAGRFFDHSFSADSANYVINDVAAAIMNNKNPIGSLISFEGNKGTVVGVFNDFHALDLAGPFVPVIICIKPQNASLILVKSSLDENKSLIEKISSVYKRYDPESLSRPELLSDMPVINSQMKVSPGLIGLASLIAVILACLGLFGLASFTAENRTKDIGIRKANGATTGSVMRLLLASYTRWITLAFAAAVPFAFFIGKSFLGKYFFHATMPLWAFIAGPLIVYAVALLTVSWQTWRIANRNPVEALRYE